MCLYSLSHIFQIKKATKTRSGPVSSPQQLHILSYLEWHIISPSLTYSPPIYIVSPPYFSLYLSLTHLLSPYILCLPFHLSLTHLLYPNIVSPLPSLPHSLTLPISRVSISIFIKCFWVQAKFVELDWKTTMKIDCDCFCIMFVLFYCVFYCCNKTRKTAYKFFQSSAFLCTVHFLLISWR